MDKLQAIKLNTIVHKNGASIDREEFRTLFDQFLKSQGWEWDKLWCDPHPYFRSETFACWVDAQGEAMLHDIAKSMSERYNIAIVEACEQVKNHFAGDKLFEMDILFHEDEGYWAEHIYTLGER